MTYVLSSAFEVCQCHQMLTEYILDYTCIHAISHKRIHHSYVLPSALCSLSVFLCVLDWIYPGLFRSNQYYKYKVTQYACKGNRQTQVVDASQDTSLANNQAVASISQPIFQFIEGAPVYWTVVNGIYSRFKT